MKEVVFTKAKKYYLSVYPKPNLPSMAKITLFAQIIQQLPKELINSLAKKHYKHLLPLKRKIYETYNKHSSSMYCI